MDWIEASHKAEIDYRNDSIDPVKTYNFVYSAMTASSLSTDTDQANEANRIAGYLTGTRNAIEEWKKANKHLEQSLAEHKAMVGELLHLTEELNKRYLKETKRPFVLYKGFAIEGFLQTAKDFTGNE